MDEQAVKHALWQIDQGNIEQGGPALVSLLGYTREEDGWAWLYSCVKTKEQKLYCVKKILRVNPNHKKGQIALVELQLAKASAELESTPKTEAAEIKQPLTSEGEYKRAIRFIKAGKLEAGRRVLLDLLKQNPEIEDAWWWLYYCANTPREKLDCLNKVLTINPSHEAQGLLWQD